MHEAGLSFSNVIAFNLDEYYGVPASSKHSYHQFMQKHLFSHIDILPENCHIPDGSVLPKDVHEQCLEYERKIELAGGLDFQLLGVGRNGHIGFNEPGTPFNSRTHVVELEESTRRANARFFDSIDDVPTHAITMGVATILESRKIILLASGKSKQEAIKKLLTEEPSEAFTASALLNHPNVTVIVDAEALPDTNLPILKQITLEDLAE